MALTKVKLKEIYPFLRRDFPTVERPPRHIFYGRVKKGLWECTALRAEDGTIQAYAVTVAGDVAVVLYLAVNPAIRSQGIGGKMISLLKERYGDGLLVEVEKVEETDNAFQQRQRQRRIDFDKRHGFEILPVEYWLFGIGMHLMFCGENPPASGEIEGIMCRAYGVRPGSKGARCCRCIAK